MKNFCLNDMVRGWFVGNFSPSVWKTENCEVAVKTYKRGDEESVHFHKIATEITLVLSGCVKMAGGKWKANDIIVLEPGEVTGFKALEDSTCIVVKTPGVLNDKYIHQKRA